MFTRSVCFLSAALLLSARADDQVRSTQEELRRRNLYFGDIDGRRTPELEEAVKRYQRKKGLSASGRDDAETLRSLGVLVPSPGDPKPKELEWPEEPVLKSDERLNVIQEASELAQSSGISPEAVQPAQIKLAPIAAHTPPPKKRPSAPASTRPSRVAAGSRVSPIQVQQSITSAEAVEFLKRFLRATSSGQLPEELCFYADRLEYYANGAVDRRVVEHTLRKYYARWPHRSYRLQRLLSFSSRPHTGEITITFTTTFTLSNGAHRVRGATENRLVINAGTSSPRIVSIHEARLRP